MKTPIQELIDELLHIVNVLELPNSNTSRTLKTVIMKLKDKLKQERHFAETCFDAGERYGIDNMLSDEDGLPQQNPDFTTFYKQYEK